MGAFIAREETGKAVGIVHWIHASLVLDDRRLLLPAGPVRPAEGVRGGGVGPG